MTDYYDRHEISRSMLATLVLDGPRTYEAMYITKTLPAPDPTADMEIGSLTHAEVLEPHLESRITVIPEEVLSGGKKMGKPWKEYLAANSDKVLLKQSEYDQAMGAARAIRKAMWGVVNHPESVREEEFYWTHEPTCLELRAKLDILQMSGEQWLLPDIKTCADVNRFADTDIRKRALWLQHAMYRSAVRAKYCHEPYFWWVAVEKTGIHKIAHVEFDAEATKEADHRYEALLMEVKRRTEEIDWADETEKSSVIVSKKQAFGWEVRD